MLQKLKHSREEIASNYACIDTLKRELKINKMHLKCGLMNVFLQMKEVKVEVIKQQGVQEKYQKRINHFLKVYQ
ncbi:unnamed protein product [Paramecium sonneborni]|uniref:Uncharacterized protein n=1 Tax=Paramecium sonneborni TaxID=65129 RepID=A0A8S1RTH0_9CILI|nr:unnamed protein product [Paramecium sonneborni]